MTDIRKGKLQDLPFILDGCVKVVKRVSKNTTCGDVIAKLPNLHTPLAVFLSVDGEMKELPGKAKLLKVWRANGAAKNVEFVIRKSETVTKKVTNNSRKVFADKTRREKQDPRSSTLQNSRLAKNTLKQVSDLAFYVRYQRLKVKNLAKNAVRNSEGREQTPQSKLMRRMTSHASTSSMDAFLEKADLDAMAQFLSFCGEVTAEKLRGRREKPQSQSVADQTFCSSATKVSSANKEPAATKKTVNKVMIQSSLKSMKLGLKQKFTSKSKLSKKTSTATITSTDTGYHSVETGSRTSSQHENEIEVDVIKRSVKNDVTLHNVLNSEETDEFQRHSTPVFKSRHVKRRVGTLDCTITEGKLDFLDNCDGKSVIFEKFMADQSFTFENTDSENKPIDPPQTKRQRLDRQSLPVFNTQEDRCRFLWNKYCDSDSDTDSDATSDMHRNLDIAFTSAEERPKRRLRRESAISNLNRFSLSNRRSLPAHAPKLNDSEEFDYSFDCSFPRMDESQDFTVDYSFSDSDVSENDLDLFRKKLSSDESLDSFMKTRSFLGDSLDYTTCEDNILERNLTLSNDVTCTSIN